MKLLRNGSSGSKFDFPQARQFGTMKRDSAGALETVVVPQSSDAVNPEFRATAASCVNELFTHNTTAMSAAMASGDVRISVSQGVPPFVVAVSAGQDLQIVDVAVSYADNDNCVVHSGLEIDKASANELAGKKVAVPLGTAAHYGFLKQMGHFGVDLGRPGRIHKEYRLPFAEMGVGADLREVKNHPEYASTREEILNMIWNMEEEIMGRTEDAA